MKLTLQRRYKTDHSTVGELSTTGFSGFSLEPTIRDDDKKPRAIPSGTYALTLRESVRFGRIMPHLENVPGFDGILIHWGNYPLDTEGCILVGENHAQNFVGNSRAAFDRLFDLLTQHKEDHLITIIDP